MPKKLVNIKKISHEEWLSLRERGIGGSESAICVNMNPYAGLLTLYAMKTGMSKPKEDNEAMRLGRDLEQYVAERFTEETGKKVINDNWFYVDDEYDFLYANIDRRVVGESAGLECKTMGSFNGYNLENGDVPSHYYCQCQHYCSVLGLDRMYLAILVLQRGLFIIPVERNEEFIKDLRKAEVDFWKNYVEKRKMPEPDGESDFDTLKALYPKEVPMSEIVIPGLDRMIAQYIAFDKEAKELKKNAESVKAQICQRLGKHEAGLGIQYGCTWKTQSKTSGYDMAKLQEDYPNINIDKYKKISEYRVFRHKDLTKKKKA